MPIAVILTTSNGAEHLSETLASISAQERLPDEVWAVDDGSTDRTVDIVRAWASKQPFPVRIGQNQFPHSGLSTAGPAGGRTTALFQTNADMIATLDQDDLMLPCHLRVTEQALLRNPRMTLCFGNAIEFHSSGLEGEKELFAGKPIEHLPFQQAADGLRILTEPVLEALAGGSFIPTAGNLWRREAGIAVDGFDRRVGGADDQLFFASISRLGQVGYYPFPIARKRIHEGNMSHPRFALRMGWDQYLTVQTLLRASKRLQLNQHEYDAVCRHLADLEAGILYHASRRGWSTYQALIGHLGAAMKPRDVVRAAVYTCRGWFVTEPEERFVRVLSLARTGRPVAPVAD